MVVVRRSKMSLMWFILKMMLSSKAGHYVALCQKLLTRLVNVHLFLALTVSDGDFSFPRLVGLLILSLWLKIIALNI
jgi:hypothetical protein